MTEQSKTIASNYNDEARSGDQNRRSGIRALAITGLCGLGFAAAMYVTEWMVLRTHSQFGQIVAGGMALFGGGLPLDEDSRDRSQLMTAMDQINARYGQGTLAIASAGMSRNPHVWAARQDRRTPSFTTDWNELAIAQA